jgi:hypothetical protein
MTVADWLFSIPLKGGGPVCFKHPVYVADVGFVATDGKRTCILQDDILVSEDLRKAAAESSFIIYGHDYTYVKKADKVVVPEIIVPCAGYRDLFPGYKRTFIISDKYRRQEDLSYVSDKEEVVHYVESIAPINPEFLVFPEYNSLQMFYKGRDLPVLFLIKGDWYSCLYAVIPQVPNVEHLSILPDFSGFMK